jgi:hypothetical protein
VKGEREVVRLRFGVTLAIAALPLAIGSSAPAAVIVGQLPPSPDDTFPCGSEADRLQPNVTSGNSYVVPAIPPATALVVSSWSHLARPDAGQSLTMKVFRPLGGDTYQVVGHDGPRALNGGVLNTFTGIEIPVRPGDLIGNSIPASGNSPGCLFFTDTGLTLGRPGNLADGGSGTFGPFDFPYRLNTQATVEPHNRFTLGGLTRNKKKGTATLTVTVPNPGGLTASGKGVKAGAANESKAVGAGAVKLRIRAKGTKKRKLNDTGKVKLNAKLSYTPTGGDPSTQSRKLKLRKRI